MGASNLLHFSLVESRDGSPSLERGTPGGWAAQCADRGLREEVEAGKSCYEEGRGGQGAAREMSTRVLG